MPLIHDGSYEDIVRPRNARMDSIPRWFPGVQLNFAENLLYTATSDGPSARSVVGKEDDKIALTEVREGGSATRSCTWGELRSRVARLAAALRKHGMKKGDRVGLVASNSIDTLAVFAATTALGGIFSSSSTDMGVKGILDRLLQIRPRYVFVDDGALYNSQTFDLLDKMKDIAAGMDGVEEFRAIVSVPRWKEALEVGSIQKCVTLADFLEGTKEDEPIQFERVGFSDPFLVVYSSGTTGTPKCIVHSVGGVLMSAMKEGVLHRDISPSTVYLQYTTVSKARSLPLCRLRSMASFRIFLLGPATISGW